MRVELSRYRVKQGKSARVDEWLGLLNQRMDEVTEALDREEMKLEVIFREVIGGGDYLYWFSVQGEEGQPVQTSPFDIDRAHIEFWEECIDHDYGRRDAQPQVIMLPEVVARSMQWENPSAAAVKFQARQLIFRRGKGWSAE